MTIVTKDDGNLQEDENDFKLDTDWINPDIPKKQNFKELLENSLQSLNFAIVYHLSEGDI